MMNHQYMVPNHWSGLKCGDRVKIYAGHPSGDPLFLEGVIIETSKEEEFARVSHTTTFISMPDAIYHFRQLEKIPHPTAEAAAIINDGRDLETNPYRININIKSTDSAEEVRRKVDEACGNISELSNNKQPEPLPPGMTAHEIFANHDEQLKKINERLELMEMAVVKLIRIQSPTDWSIASYEIPLAPSNDKYTVAYLIKSAMQMLEKGDSENPIKNGSKAYVYKSEKKIKRKTKGTPKKK